MTGKPLRLISVGKLKKSFWKDAAAHYESRLERWRHLESIQVREADGPPQSRNRLEGRKILQNLSSRDIPLVLDERGEGISSVGLAAILQKTDQESSGILCFIIGGAYGLDDAVHARAHRLLRLSDMTLPHEMARVFLLEQIYRAECISRNIPYHH
ncbi:MAG: 23S rRNA (pseudouridine(1915)-N(3))-methyltransferase RlmH [Desulfovibrio sp.]|jgi:23S rRNA (pseudouridine1915-N3)-methyltransferase|nr:23S rRNA (pseudouridine(1915)-N(3))-methyltransferase RlmH [Desulfovibrio sp.]